MSHTSTPTRSQSAVADILAAESAARTAHAAHVLDAIDSRRHHLEPEDARAAAFAVWATFIGCRGDESVTSLPEKAAIFARVVGYLDPPTSLRIAAEVFPVSFVADLPGRIRVAFDRVARVLAVEVPVAIGHGLAYMTAQIVVTPHGVVGRLA